MPDPSTAPALAITERGAGPSIVFTHGWADDATSWDGVAADLSADHHCLTYDLRAHGRSEVAPPGAYTRDHALHDLTQVMSLADAPTVLAGHSLGGYLSLAQTIAQPDQVRGLILVAAGPGFRKPEAREQWNASVDVSAAELGVPAGSEELSKHVDSWVIDNLDKITVPVLCILGERDKRFAASLGLFEKVLDVRESVIVPDAGHRVHAKAPAPVAAAIRRFMEGL